MPVEKWSESIWLVKLSDEPALSEDLIAARDQAEQASPPPHLVIDFSGVRHINSSNLSQLLRLRKLSVDRDTRIRLAALPDSVWAVFLTTGLDKLFEFMPDLPTALASLQIGDEADE